MNHQLRCALLSAALACAPSLFAVTWTEVGNAGHTVATAQDTTGVGPLTSIAGILDPDSVYYSNYSQYGTDVDFFRITLVGGNFSAATTSDTDPMLFLFDAGGNTLLFNDDASGLQAFISGTFAAGDYILGISRFDNGYNTSHANSGFNAIETNLPANWDEMSGSSPYTVTLTGAAPSGASVPDTGSTTLLLGVALCGLVGASRRFRK